MKSTYYVLDAQGNQLSTYEHVVENEESNYQLSERVMYGSSRLGINTNKVDMLDENPEEILSLELGNKLYEMSNHLGNVLTVINDVRIPQSSNSVDVDGYLATIVSTADYSPFGVHLDERTVSGESYRYGYQGSEKDDEVKGKGNSYTTEFRMLDPRLGRWLSIDPLAAEFPWQSPYCSMDNNPAMLNDILGLESSKEKPTVYDERSAREHRRANKYAFETNEKFRKDNVRHAEAKVYQYEKGGRYRYGVEVVDYLEGQDSYITVAAENGAAAGAGIQRLGKVKWSQSWSLVSNWWWSVNNEGFEGGLSY